MPNQILRFVVFLVGFHSLVLGQSRLEYSYMKIHQAANDTGKVNALNHLAMHHINANQDSAEFYATQALKLSQALNYTVGIGSAKIAFGALESDRGNFPQALDNILEAQSIAQREGDHQLLVRCKLNLGNLYVRTNEVGKALETYRSGLPVCEENHMYSAEGNLYISIGMALRLQGQLDSALFYYDKVLELQYEVVHDSIVIASIYNNIAAVHYAREDLQTAENYLVKSLEINKMIGNDRHVLMNLSNLAGLFGHPENGNLKKSTMYFRTAIDMAKRLKAKEALQSIYETMSKVYYNHSEYKDAYIFLDSSLKYKDSILGPDKLIQLESISEEYEKRQIRDSLYIKEQELALSKSNEEAANLQASKSTWQLLGAVIALLGISVVLYFVYRNSKNQKKINAILQSKNEEINHQKLQIEEKNTELTDSINYALRIQQALLPSRNYLTTVLGDHFLIFRPKDIVSGDFYWVKKHQNQHLFAVADCTGHGVPGAMMSMLGFETIDRVSNSTHASASDFLNAVNESLVKSLTGKAGDRGESSEVVKDGMDLALCIVTDKKKLSFCGANNECYVIRQNDKLMPAESAGVKLIKGDTHTVIELKATKRPVGYYDSMHPFIAYEVDLFADDRFYLFSDGYADQFGGDKGKKLKTSTFRDNLLKTASLSIQDQCTFMEKFLNDWQKNFDQLDDITVLGVRIE